MKESFDDDDAETTGPWVQIIAHVLPGNSGGGAFTKDGTLVGIASWIKGGAGISFFVHPETIQNFLITNKIKHYSTN
jgi:S1-C subfamily serine protease